jgi:Gelsolin repeat
MLKVWRIEQFRVVAWDADKYGSFFTGDSYVVLNSYEKEDSDALGHDIHIWIGKESSQGKKALKPFSNRSSEFVVCMQMNTEQRPTKWLKQTKSLVAQQFSTEK